MQKSITIIHNYNLCNYRKVYYFWNLHTYIRVYVLRYYVLNKHKNGIEIHLENIADTK